MSKFVGILLWLLPLAAGASSLDVDPIRVTFSAKENITVLTLTNYGDAPVTVQLEPVSWTQSQSQDVYTPTRDLLATPPIFTVPAQAKQVIRVGLRVPPDPHVEKCYRLYLQEVPQPSQVKGLGVVMALRIGVPVFVEPLAPAAPSLQWAVHRVSDTELQVTLTNSGTQHVQLTALTITGPDKLSQELKQSGYILPGQSRSWSMPLAHAPAAGTPLKLDGSTDQGTIHESLVLQ